MSNITKQIVSELENVQQQLHTFQSNVSYLEGAKKNLEESKSEAKKSIDEAVRAMKEGEDHLIRRINELSKTIDAISGLTDASSSIINKIEGVDFPIRLANIEKGILDSIVEIEKHKDVCETEIKILSKEVQDVDFHANFVELKKIIVLSADSNKAIPKIIESQNIPEKINNFQVHVIQQIKTGVEKLEIAGTKTNTETLKIVQDLNIPSRMDKLDANVAGIQASLVNLMTKSDHLERDIREHFERVNKTISLSSKTIKAKQTLLLIFLIVLVLGTAAGFFLLTKNQFH